MSTTDVEAYYVRAAAVVVATASGDTLTADEVINRVNESTRADTNGLVEFAIILVDGEDRVRPAAVKMLFDQMTDFGFGFVEGVLRGMVENAKAKSAAKP